MRTTKKFEGKFVTALGWGYGDTPHKVCLLRAVNLELSPPEMCRDNVATVICAELNGGGRDTCMVIGYCSI